MIFFMPTRNCEASQLHEVDLFLVIVISPYTVCNIFLSDIGNMIFICFFTHHILHTLESIKYFIKEFTLMSPVFILLQINFGSLLLHFNYV